MIRSVAILTLSSVLAGCSTFMSAPQGTWSTRAALPQKVGEVGVTELDGHIYVVGGTERQENARDIYTSTQNLMYDPAKNTWQRLAPLPQGLTHVGVASLGGKLYAVGGFTNVIHLEPVKSAFVYDPNANTWSKLADISGVRGSVSAAAVGGKLHIFGGRNSSEVEKLPPPFPGADFSAGFGTVTTHEIYDPATGRWSPGAPLPGPGRDHLGMAVLNGKVHVFGGRTRDTVDNVDRHDVYDPATDQWTAAAPLPTPRSSGAATVLNGQVLYAGGECKTDAAGEEIGAFDDVTAYNPKTNTWAKLPSLPQPRHAFGAATVNGVAYFTGGPLGCGGGDGPTSDLLAYSSR